MRTYLKEVFLYGILTAFFSYGMDGEQSSAETISPPMDLPATISIPLFQDYPFIGAKILSFYNDGKSLNICNLALTSKIFHPSLFDMIEQKTITQHQQILFISRLPDCQEKAKESSLKIDLFYSSDEKEITDDILKTYIDAFPNMAYLRLNIIYLSEKGLRQLTQLHNLKTLILECRYNEVLTALRHKAGEVFRTEYYPKRLKICQEVIKELEEEFKNLENQEQREFIVGSFPLLLKKYKEHLERATRYIYVRDKDKTKKAEVKKLYDEAIEKVMTCQNKQEVDTFFQDFTDHLVAIQGDWILISIVFSYKLNRHAPMTSWKLE